MSSAKDVVVSNGSVNGNISFRLIDVGIERLLRPRDDPEEALPARSPRPECPYSLNPSFDRNQLDEISGTRFGVRRITTDPVEIDRKRVCTWSRNLAVCVDNCEAGRRFGVIASRKKQRREVETQDLASCKHLQLVHPSPELAKLL